MDRQRIGGLRSYTWGETLDAGFRLWRDHFGTFLLAAVTIALPGVIGNFLVVNRQVHDITSGGLLLVEDPDTFDRIVDLGALLQGFALTLALSTMLIIAVARYVGEPMTLGSALITLAKRIIPALALAFILGVTLRIAQAHFLFLVPGVIAAVSLALAFPAFWAERKGPTAAITRGWQLVSGRRWPVFGLVLVAAGLAMLIWFSAAMLAGVWLGTQDEFIFDATWWVVITLLMPGLMLILIAPLLPCLVTAAYYDARVTDEAYDLELALAKLDTASADDGPPGGWSTR